MCSAYVCVLVDERRKLKHTKRSRLSLFKSFAVNGTDRDHVTMIHCSRMKLCSLNVYSRWFVHSGLSMNRIVFDNLIHYLETNDMNVLKIIVNLST